MLEICTSLTQWVSFQDEDNFEKSIAHLIDALKENHISPSSTEETLKEEEAEIQEDAEPPKHHSFSGGVSRLSTTIVNALFYLANSLLIVGYFPPYFDSVLACIITF